MRNILLVAICDSLKNLLGHDRSFELTKLLALCNFVEQLYTVAKFGDQEDTALVLVHFVEPNDVWMIEILKDVDLVVQPHSLLFAHVQFVNDLDRTEFSC